MSQDVVVCVLAGKWKCLDNGQWKFIMDKGRQGRAMTLTDGLLFTGLMDIIEAPFDVNRKKLNIQLSFWCPQTSNYCTQTRLPPVTLGCDSELRQFRAMLSRNNGMNIFVTFEEREDDHEGCFNLSLDDVDQGDGEGDILFQESKVALLDSMEANRKAKTDSEGSSQCPKRCRLSNESISLPTEDGGNGGRGIPTLPTPAPDENTKDNGNNLLIDGNDSVESPTETPPGPSTAIVSVADHFLDSSEYENLMRDLNPQLDNLVEYRQDERIKYRHKCKQTCSLAISH